MFYLCFFSVSVSISIINSIITFNISTLNRHHKLVKHLVVYELDVRSNFQGSGDTTTSTSVW